MPDLRYYFIILRDGPKTVCQIIFNLTYAFWIIFYFKLSKFKENCRQGSQIFHKDNRNNNKNTSDFTRVPCEIWPDEVGAGMSFLVTLCLLYSSLRFGSPFCSRIDGSKDIATLSSGCVENYLFLHLKASLHTWKPVSKIAGLYYWRFKRYHDLKFRTCRNRRPASPESNLAHLRTDL